MHASSSNNPRSLARSVSIAFLILVFTSSAAQAQKTSAQQSKVKIRAITAFVNLDRSQYQLQIADAVKMLKRAQIIFESRGFTVQTIRIATQPFPQYIQGLTKDQALTFFRDYDLLATQDGFSASIGPAMIKRATVKRMRTCSRKF